MKVPNKDEWYYLFQQIFSDLSQRKLPDSSLQYFESKKPLICERNKLASFQCPNCSHSWESAHGVVRMKYRLHLDPKTKLGRGIVTVRIFGQSCKLYNCPYATAIFDWDSIESLLQKFHKKIGQKFYGDGPSNEDAKFDQEEVVIGRGVHDNVRCEACQLGGCQLERAHKKKHGRRRNENKIEENRISEKPKKGSSDLFLSNKNLRPMNNRVRWSLKFDS